MTGWAPGAPAASTSSVETPASFRSRANASARAAASPIRMLVKLPGPVPTTSRRTSRGWAPARSSNSSASASTRTARDARSPSTFPSARRALVATLVAVSNASVSIAAELGQQLPVSAFELDRPAFAVHVRQTYRDAHGRERMFGRLRPFDEADRVFEVRLQIAPFGRRKPLETEEIEVRDVRVPLVAVTHREGWAGHGNLDPEGAAGAPDEGRLAGTELPRDCDHVADPEPAGKARRDRFRLGRGEGHSRKTLSHLP